MITRVIQFRWRILLIFTITLLLVLWDKIPSDRRSSFTPYVLTNSFFNEMIQTIKTESMDTTIVLISGPAYNYEGDSIIAELVQKISVHQPKVIAIDYDFNNPNLLEQFPVHDSVKIVLAAVIDENDSILYPLNIFKSNVHYGSAMGYGDNSNMIVNNELIISLPEMVMSLSEPTLYKKYLERGNETEIINYTDPQNILVIQSEDVLSDQIMDGFLRNKVILIGKLGSTFLIAEPGILDNVDVHETPIGTQFGAVILYNEIRTLLGNFINRSSLLLDYSLIVFLSCFNIFIVLGLSHLNKKVLYIITKLQMTVLIMITVFVGALFFDAYNFEFDYQSLCLTTILSAELSFWFTLK